MITLFEKFDENNKKYWVCYHSDCYYILHVITYDFSYVEYYIDFKSNNDYDYEKDMIRNRFNIVNDVVEKRFKTYEEAKEYVDYRMTVNKYNL